MTDYLSDDKFNPLKDQIEFISGQANIPEKYLRYVGAREYCTEAEMHWIRNTKKNIRDGSGGMILYGAQVHPINKKMLAIGATLTRNFIDARVYTLFDLLESLDVRGSEPPECTVLLIPDLCLADYDIPKKSLHKLNGFLLNHFAKDRALIAYIDSLKVLGEKYGSTFVDTFTNHYQLFSSVAEKTI